jgi:3',5'-cyclic-AMP phosphodiesterase
MANRITHNHADDGVDRRGFLECMAWAGTGLVWAAAGGLPTSRSFARGAIQAAKADFTFVQISDSHIGFKKEPNKDVVGTLQQTINQINALPERPELMIHTGDLTHLAKPEEFDTVAEVLKSTKVGNIVYVPGEHDIFTDDGKLYHASAEGPEGSAGRASITRGSISSALSMWPTSSPAAWECWVTNSLNGSRRTWPGWGTQDSAQALALLRRFGSVTVLNGHIHQILQKVEGNVTFHTARSTAFPQPEPGKAASPGPMKNVAADQLRRMLGLTKVSYVQGKGALAVVDAALEGA